MTKLTDGRIKFICRHVVDKKDWSEGVIANHFGITKKRVYQLVKRYVDTGEIPKLNPQRRPKSPSLTNDEKRVIDTVWEETRFGARLLYKELKKRKYNIPHHKIHKYLRETNRTIPNPNKQKKRKRCRYERHHSFSLIHGDWHRTTENHPHAIAWLDDSSRFALTGAEFPEANMAHSIETFQEAEQVARVYNASIREVNTDRGTEFYSNHPNSRSKFQLYLIERGVQHIPSRRNNPQTNGKLERFWYEYDKHRWRFSSMEEFLKWYNNRLHGALWVDLGETPAEAVIRKLQPECILGLFMKVS